MTKILIVLLQRVTIAVWLSFTSLLVYYVLVRRGHADATKWSQPPPAAATATANMLRHVVSGGAFVTLPRTPCPGFLAVVVCSAPEHGPERLAIRETWARDVRPERSAVYFLVGKRPENNNGGAKQTLSWTALLKPGSPETRGDSSLLPESSVFGDMIRADFVDTGGNGTLKTLLLLQWARTFCPRVSFILKADDDAYVDVPRLVSLLERKQAAFENDTHRRGSDPGFLLGKRHEAKSIVSNNESRYDVVPGAHHTDALPTYLSGVAYVLSGGVVGPLLRKALDTPALHLEDVFLTGLVASELGLSLIHSPCFACCEELPDPCAYRRLLAATVSKPDSLRNVWNRVRDKAAERCPPRNDTDDQC